MLYLPPERKISRATQPYERPAAPDWPAQFAQLAQTTQSASLQEFYQAGTPDGDTPIGDVPLVALDFETTGFDPQTHGIVSVGLVPMSLERIQCRLARHWILRPRVELLDESITVHGITHQDVEHAPDLSEILDEFLLALRGKIVIVHYREIERQFLNVALNHRLGEDIQFPVIDTMDLEARVHRAQPPGFLARLLGRRPESIRLAASRQRYRLPPYRPHSALTDALAAGELFMAQVAHRYDMQTPLREFWL